MGGIYGFLPFCSLKPIQSLIWLLHVTTHLLTGNAPPSTPAIGTLESLIASSRDPLVDLGGAEQRKTLRGISHALAGAL